MINRRIIKRKSTNYLSEIYNTVQSKTSIGCLYLDKFYAIAFTQWRKSISNMGNSTDWLIQSPIFDPLERRARVLTLTNQPSEFDNKLISGSRRNLEELALDKCDLGCYRCTIGTCFVCFSWQFVFWVWSFQQRLPMLFKHGHRMRIHMVVNLMCRGWPIEAKLTSD